MKIWGKHKEVSFLQLKLFKDVKSLHLFMLSKFHNKKSLPSIFTAQSISPSTHFMLVN